MATKQRPHSAPAVKHSESVFDWNNQACLALQKGRFQVAASILIHILMRLVGTKVDRETSRMRIPSVVRTNPNNVSYVSDDEDEEEDISSFLLLLTVPISPELPQEAPVISRDNPFVLFDQSVVTAYRDEDQVTRDANSKRIVTAFVHFNLGLCVQFKEGLNKEDYPSMLRGANHSYVKALKVLDRYSEDGITEDALFLKLALYNNLGHLYQRLGQREEAARCSRHIRLLLLSQRTAQFPMNPRDWQFFVHTSELREQAEASNMGPILVG